MSTTILTHLFCFYFLLFLLLCHASLLTCLYGQKKLEHPGLLLWTDLDPSFRQSCPVLPSAIFSLSEWLLQSHPQLAVLIAKHTNNMLRGLGPVHGFVLLSGVLLTIAENMVCYYYVVMMPLWILQKGVKLLMYAAIGLILALLVMSYMHNGDLDLQHEIVNEKIERGVEGLGMMIVETVKQMNITYAQINSIY